jgi:hypothetical protein
LGSWRPRLDIPCHRAAAPSITSQVDRSSAAPSPLIIRDYAVLACTALLSRRTCGEQQLVEVRWRAERVVAGHSGSFIAYATQASDKNSRDGSAGWLRRRWHHVAPES